MKYQKSLFTSLAFAATALLALQNGAQATGLVSGTLTCDSNGGVGQVFSSSKELNCEFIPISGHSINDRYVGRIENYGLDLGVTGRLKMTWWVLATSANAHSKGALAGSYGGVGSSVGLAAGAGSQLLGFGPANGLTLQPLSVDAHEGLNLALGVSKMSLAPAYTVQHASYHHKKSVVHKKNAANKHKKAAVQHKTTKK
ncbi:DUF992 domain-containing protein [uncultured Bartonella sp.]|uniref:DUF992 domain-containing protein n=1 Tax=uncultured Bartonella sp. TaxID=104108 RepID=UPI0026179E65|nr:DUF992 domain-containing protein [uncultured Bartonella sp.]